MTSPNYDTDLVYQEQFVFQQQTLISVLKEQILRLQGELCKIQKQRDQKQALYENALNQIEVITQKNVTLQQNNESLLQTLQVFQKQYMKRGYNNVLDLPNLSKKKSIRDGPYFMELIRNMKNGFKDSQGQFLKVPEKSYLSDYYGFFFHSEVDSDQSDLYNQMLPPKVLKASRIRTYGKKNCFNQRFRHFFWANIIENKLKITDKLYDLLVEKYCGNRENEIQVNSLIDMDLRRMDFKLDEEKSKSMTIELKKCLEVFKLYRPDIGYIQGMSYIAWMFLIRMQGFEAFLCFCNVMLCDPFINSLYMFKESNIRKIIAFYGECLEDKKPKLARHMKKLDVEPELYLIQWAYTFYSRAFSLRIISKIWDLWFSGDFNVFFKVAMVVLEMLEPDILEQNENDKVIDMIRTQTHRLDEQQFIRLLHRQRLFEDLKIQEPCLKKE